MVPSLPTATPRGPPEIDQRRTTFWSREETGASVFGSAAVRRDAAERVSSPSMWNLLLECVGEVFDDRIRKEPFTHLTKAGLDVTTGLPTFRKRYTKQLADPHIFHAGEPKRAQRVLNGFPLRVED